jgi:predicted N-acyltransferase
MDDYLGSMKTKFRTRAKRVFKQSAEITIKTLTEADILENRSRISELFGNVIKKSDFSAGRLKTDVFELFKRNLKEKFSLRAFYLDDEMVGFSTSFLNGDILEANYVGLDYKYNNEKSVYQRILYDYVEQSLKYKLKELHLGRTAELIKSSIGAIPKNMTLYAKHRNSIHNMLLKPIIESISPSEFELRKPFKTNHIN